MTEPGLVEPEDVAVVQRDLRRALTAWAVVSTATGAAVRVLAGSARSPRRPVLAGFGTQTALWGVVDGAIAGVAALTADREQDPATLRRVLLLNAVLDVGYVAAGGALAARPRSAPRWLRWLRWPDRSGVHLRGHGIAVVVQGSFLLVLDAVNARRLGPWRE